MFSLPLLYTMEVWWAGFILQPGRILFYVCGTYALLLLYNRFAGLRRDASMVEVAIDSVEEMGIGILLATTVLWLTGRLTVEMDWLEITGKIIMQAMTVAIGVSVGTAQLGVPGKSGLGGENCDSYLPQTAIALCGAVLFAANIAPTDEIPTMAVTTSAVRLVLLSIFSILLGALVLQFAAFRGSDRYVPRDGVTERLRGVVTTYAVALFASAALLWVFGRFDAEPVSMWVSQTVVLAVPAALGASAGRLLLQAGETEGEKQ